MRPAAPCSGLQDGRADPFEAKDAFPFKNDDRLGTVATPIVPEFVVVK